MNETQEKLCFLTLLNKFQITKIWSQITKIRNYYLEKGIINFCARATKQVVPPAGFSLVLYVEIGVLFFID